MKLLLKRIAKRADYTIGHLNINGKYFCDTLEDTDRGLMQSLPTSVNVAKKKKGATAHAMLITAKQKRPKRPPYTPFPKVLHKH